MSINKEELIKLYTREEVRLTVCPECFAQKGEYCFGRTREALLEKIPKGRRVSNHLQRVEEYHKRTHRPMFWN